MLRENLRIVVGNKDMVAAGIVAFVVVAVVQRLYKTIKSHKFQMMVILRCGATLAACCC